MELTKKGLIVLIVLCIIVFGSITVRTYKEKSIEVVTVKKDSVKVIIPMDTVRVDSIKIEVKKMDTLR